MKKLFLIMTLFFCIPGTNAMSYPKIEVIKDNTDYLLIHEKSLPIVDIEISFAIGSKDDGNLKGITNYSIELLHQQKINGEKIIDSFEKVGALYNSSVNRDSSSLKIRFIKNDKNIEFISKKLNEILKAENLSATPLEYTRDVIINSITSRDLSPASIISYKTNEEFFVGTGYSHPISGYKNIIEEINITDIKKHIKKIININNIKVSMVGDINENEATYFISRVLSNVPMGNDYVSAYNKLNYQGNSKIRHIAHDSKQTHISIYIPSITRKHKNFYNILVANYIFGGSGFGSMLMQEIREKNGLAYSVYSYLAPFKDIGVLKIGMQTESKNTVRSLEILKAEIDKFKKFDISNEKVKKAKLGLLKSFELRLDTNKKMLSTLSAINSYEMHDNYFEEYIEGINLVTKESIISSLKSDLDFENISINTVGNN